MPNNIPDYNAAVRDIRAEIEEYCRLHEINPDDYFEAMDGKKTANFNIDNSSYDAYFQLTYMQLMEIIDPEEINSLKEQIGHPPSFETLYKNADKDLNDMIRKMVEDDPYLMQYVAHREGGQSEADAVFKLIEEDLKPQESFTKDARDFNKKNNMGSMDWISDKEDGFKAAEMSILDQLNEFDAQWTDLVEQFKSGGMNETQFKGGQEEISQNREQLMVMLQSVTDAEANFFEMLSKLVQQAQEMQMGIIGKWV